MTHLLTLFRCRPGVAPAPFLRDLCENHAPRVAAMPQVRRLVLDVAAPSQGALPQWHGVEELWVDDDRAAHALLRNPLFTHGPLATHDVHGARVDAVRLRTTDHVVVAGSPIDHDEDLPKRMTFLRRKPGMTREASLRYWREVHGPLAGSVPGLRRYVQSTVLHGDRGDDDGDGDGLYDGVAQIWLEGDEALRRIVASDLFLQRVKPDEANFTATDVTLTLPVRERRWKIPPS